MFKTMLHKCCLAVLSIGVLVGQSFAQTDMELTYPNQYWSYYASPEQAGFIPERLAKVEKFYNRRAFAGLLIVKDGAIAVDWGENSRRFLVHSISKSMLSALYGVHSADINLRATLQDIEINDNGALTAEERSATLLDILSSRSGVYLPAAAEGGQMLDNKPERGQYSPGTHWFYDNWDFNVAGTIYTQLTGEAIPQAFARHLAEPLQMQDFRDFDGYAVTSGSEHQADQFRMSSRDLARLGLLYLRNGNWRGQQLIPQMWINASTRAVSETNMGNKFPPHYGYMWWVNDDGSYSARGVGGHTLAVYPERDLVVVLRTNTYLEHSVSARAIRKILEGIVSASEGKPASQPMLTIREDNKATPQALPSRFQHKELNISLENGQVVSLNSDDQHMFVDLGTGKLELSYITDNQFTIIDRQEPVEVSLNANNQIIDFRTPRLFYLRAALAAQQGDLDTALNWVKEVLVMQPYSAMAYTNMARIYMAMGDKAKAKEMVDEALKYDSDHKQANGLKQTIAIKQWLFPVVAALGAGILLIIFLVIQKRKRPA
ncbi:serine hydrolase [Alteromonas arenosi]|nr:serine hydrolase [Alteromonas sp. ASW11-36]